jgi:hypothetical protein
MAAPGANSVMPLMKHWAPMRGDTSGVVRAPPPRSWLLISEGRSTQAWGSVFMLNHP